MPAYAPVDGSRLAGALADTPAIRDRLGDADAWRIREVGDGNLNLVFIVEGRAGGVVVKQALPYVRLVGESWPLPLERWCETIRADAPHVVIFPEIGMDPMTARLAGLRGEGLWRRLRARGRALRGRGQESDGRQQGRDQRQVEGAPHWWAPFGG